MTHWWLRAPDCTRWKDYGAILVFLFFFLVLQEKHLVWEMASAAGMTREEYFRGGNLCTCGERAAAMPTDPGWAGGCAALSMSRGVHQRIAAGAQHFTPSSWPRAMEKLHESMGENPRCRHRLAWASSLQAFLARR